MIRNDSITLKAGRKGGGGGREAFCLGMREACCLGMREAFCLGMREAFLSWDERGILVLG